MCKQMDIFGFIKNVQESEKTEQKTLFEKLFIKTNDPVMQCANCLCERCVNNVEDIWNKISPEEQKIACFNCDECYQYTGNTRHRLQRKADCSEFEISEYAATSRRKKIKIIT